MVHAIARDDQDRFVRPQPKFEQTSRKRARFFTHHRKSELSPTRAGTLCKENCVGRLIRPLLEPIGRAICNRAQRAVRAQQDRAIHPIFAGHIMCAVFTVHNLHPWF